ncbi:MAG: DUF3375 domain-containing protein [Immundisolibacteraceae bacterium]|nr:DUF3375 domain-containing protein [Immundisolibacteraceae bacterium]
MTLEYQALESLRLHHPAWRLLASPHAPLVASFLERVFINQNARVIGQADLAEALEDELFQLRELHGDTLFPKTALAYLNDWAATDKGWLRRFYRQHSDEVQFDLTPATEKAITWLQGLSQRSFVGTESRLLTLFELLRQLSEGSEQDPASRLQELQKRRDQIDLEIAEIEQGHVPLLDDTALKDRFMQFSQQARELLADFREVEHNFRQLDRRVREKIATWQGGKGELLAQIMGERDAIADSDQGSSFRGFWDFLMSPQRQQEFGARLDKVLTLPAITEMSLDPRTRRIHHDWLEAGEYTQRMVAQLSQQLRRFLDDQAWLENRRIMDIIQGIETKTLNLKNQHLKNQHLQEQPDENQSTQLATGLFNPPFKETTMHVDGFGADINMPMERLLYSPPIKPIISSIKLETGDEAVNLAALYSQVRVNRAALTSHIRAALQIQPQISLHQLCQQRPLAQGLAELLTYLELGDESSAGERFTMLIDDTIEDTIHWLGDDQTNRSATMPRVTYLRPTSQPPANRHAH